jgi:hypothetical protein
MNKTTRYSPEIRERAVRMVFEHQADYESQWAAMNSIAAPLRTCLRQNSLISGKIQGSFRCSHPQEPGMRQ